MKSLFTLSPILLAMTGCAASGALHGGSGPSENEPGLRFSSITTDMQNNFPRLAIPAAGGAAVLAIPLGAGVYLPVTGEPPTPGVPID